MGTSVLEPGWINDVKSIGSRPIMFVAEGVLMYFTEEQVKRLFALLVEHFPGCLFAFDSVSPLMVKNQKRHDAMKFFSATVQWGVWDIRNIQRWDDRHRILEVATFRDMESKYLQRMGRLTVMIFSMPLLRNTYRLSLTRLG